MTETHDETETSKKQELDTEALKMLEHNAGAVEQILAADEPCFGPKDQTMPNLWQSLNTLGVITYQTDGLTGDSIKDARHLVELARNFLANRSLNSLKADAKTLELITLQGKVVSAMEALEGALSTQAAEEVKTLKDRVADKLGAIIYGARESDAKE